MKEGADTAAANWFRWLTKSHLLLAPLHLVCFFSFSCSKPHPDLARSKFNQGEEGEAFSLNGTWQSPCVAGESRDLRIGHDSIQTTVRQYQDPDCKQIELQLDFIGVYEIGERLPSPPYPESTFEFTWQNALGYVIPKTPQAVATLNGTADGKVKLCGADFYLNRVSELTANRCMEDEPFLDTYFTVSFGSARRGAGQELIFGLPGRSEAQRPTGILRVFVQNPETVIGPPTDVGGKAADTATTGSIPPSEERTIIQTVQ